MRKILKLSNVTLQKKVSLISSIAGITLSEAESALLAEVIELSSNNQILLSPNVSSHIRAKLNITQSSFGTSLFRLEQKQAIKKNGRNLILHPLYKDILSVTEVLIKLEHANESTE